ncbi:MAG: thiamine pyrophosphate-dependent enzyme, partial [Candidatus Azambacteria bacterium]|nr:thiamine pyrophosphate-dependent enzyme [Candidatus Azambacteria bacterium]
MLDKNPRDRELLKKLYFEMLRIRRVEEKLIEWCNTGLIKAPVHLSIGQEAVAVGVMAALKPQDKIVSTHRCHGHYLAKGGDLKKMMAEIL